jgi:hypothetical protein
MRYGTLRSNHKPIQLLQELKGFESLDQKRREAGARPEMKTENGRRFSDERCDQSAVRTEYTTKQRPRNRLLKRGQRDKKKSRSRDNELVITSSKSKYERRGLDRRKGQQQLCKECTFYNARCRKSDRRILGQEERNKQYR